jgi:hypothetical protein
MELDKLFSGIVPGYDSATGFPVRSHHLSGRNKEGQRLRVNSFTTTNKPNYTPGWGGLSMRNAKRLNRPELQWAHYNSRREETP